MQIIGLAGPAGCGKDTAADYLCKEYGFLKYSFAKPLKAMLEALGLPAEDYESRELKEATHPSFGVSYRKMAQTLGTEWGRNLIHPDIWVIAAAKKLEQLKKAGCRGVVIADCRFDNEATFIRKHGKLIHIKGRELPLAKDGQNHASEGGVKFAIATDEMFFNNFDIPNLHKQIDLFMGDD